MNRIAMFIISTLFLLSTVSFAGETKSETKKIVAKKNTRNIVTSTNSSNWSKIKDLFM